MDRSNIPTWIAAGAAVFMAALVFFGDFATKDDIAAIRADVRELRRELRDSIGALNNRIDNVLLADREPPAQ